MKRAFPAPGLGIAVAVRRTIVWSSSCGLADRDRRVPMTRSTLFRIGSVARPLTAVAERLAQADDSPLQRYMRARYSAGGSHAARTRGDVRGVNRTGWRS
jgi:CubicO group peptidase (beta-lactamase class C family)